LPQETVSNDEDDSAVDLNHKESLVGAVETSLYDEQEQITSSYGYSGSASHLPAAPLPAVTEKALQSKIGSRVALFEHVALGIVDEKERERAAHEATQRRHLSTVFARSGAKTANEPQE